MPLVDGSAIKDFDPMPPATYNAIFSAFQNKNSENVSLEFEIDDPEWIGRKQFFNHNLKPQSLWKFKQSCVAMGADPEEFVGMFDTDKILTNLLGAKCRIDVGVQGPEAGQYEGRNQVLGVLAPTYVLR